MSETKKIALVSGATKGIGEEVVRQLSQKNIVVLIGARELAKGKAIAKELQDDGMDAHAIKLDVTDQASVDGAAQFIKQHYGVLDILINNAGVGNYAEVDALSLAIFKEIYEVNVFGVVRLTEAMLPLLKKSGDGRIINLSSNLGSLHQTQDPQNPASGAHLPAYNSSKSAVNALTVQLAKFLKSDNIVINAIDPGFTNTAINGHTGTRTVQQSAGPIVELALAKNSPNGNFLFENQPTEW
jgi:NAD(P)-dependent dehydrogenase (short-subunit alcohol dehydrogenase family)